MDKNISYKKKWQKPELVILVKDESAVAILAFCKGSGVNGPGDFSTYGGCTVMKTLDRPCVIPSGPPPGGGGWNCPQPPPQDNVMWACASLAYS